MVILDTKRSGDTAHSCYFVVIGVCLTSCTGLFLLFPYQYLAIIMKQCGSQCLIRVRVSKYQSADQC